uniref:Eukaryotic translation initiation factor 4E n=1 Tax=Calcidiscus leptoporus TaxID=127549 RepID=A0A7S0J362_9EUKA|mmetsp:Transcript_36670/g.85668  ORF Transcript_36670/g.85668 Transcript_36670/m.85668 type:complete len:246 (+) Transcript_36670:235-972(+)|eukprot:CAMPEP_0119375058 /NCGR_PEP_ID=MMETSP1334-20130426/33496_1 /TAXON_ID=127549 /ORGANISM="Calcidiscus leptoporus, Strain RCC1130" /LENGTH=245 /DNA_ID=CAMNT_0007393263 /DNA_START=224 /DNA_END=961 /DNA_ORIENTATION=-
MAQISLRPGGSVAISTAPEEHALPHSWVVWEQWAAEASSSYGECIRPIATAHTVESFWSAYRQIAQPSQLFTGSKVESLSVFLAGIRPAWEEDANANGGELYCRRSGSPQQLDRLWHMVVLGIVGGSIEGAVELVTGVRVVKKSSGGRVTHRLEVWIRTEEASTPLRNALVAALQSAPDETAPADASIAAPPSVEPPAPAATSLDCAQPSDRNAAAIVHCLNQPLNTRGLRWEYRSHKKANQKAG